MDIFLKVIITLMITEQSMEGSCLLSCSIPLMEHFRKEFIKGSKQGQNPGGLQFPNWQCDLGQLTSLKTLSKLLIAQTSPVVYEATCFLPFQITPLALL